jgi:hypothetical protein
VFSALKPRTGLPVPVNTPFKNDGAPVSTDSLNVVEAGTAQVRAVHPGSREYSTGLARAGHPRIAQRGVDQVGVVELRHEAVARRPRREAEGQRQRYAVFCKAVELG